VTSQLQEWAGITECVQGIHVADDQREQPGSVVQQLKLEPPWNFIFFYPALDKSDIAMVSRAVLLT
jgi:hypothetical protein